MSPNVQLQEQARFLKDYAEKNNIVYIPLNEITTELTNQIRQNKNDDDMMVFTGSDGVHPKPNSAGAYLLGILAAYEQTRSGCVADVKIDVLSNEIYAENAKVKNIKINDEGVTYVYEPQSLPLAVNSAYNGIVNEFDYDITPQINNELLSVKNLGSGHLSAHYR